MNRLYTIAAILTALFVMIGCAGGQEGALSDSPLSPETPGLTLGRESDSTESGHQLWAYYMVYVDPEENGIEIVPIRQVTQHYNVVRWLEQKPCSDCLKIDVKDKQPSPDDGTWNWTVDMEVQHPFPDRPNLTGFDVRGIVMFDGSYTFHSQGLNTSDRRMGDSELLNADGYTTLYNGGTEGCGPKGLWGYIRGEDLHVPEFPPNAALNGYIRYASDDSACNAFHRGDSVRRTYEINTPGSELVMAYAVDANWAPPIKKPATNPCEDFGPDAHCPEPWWIKVAVTPPDGLTDKGGQTDVFIKVYDWQGATSYFPPSIECPELFHGAKTAGWLENGDGWTRYKITITNEKLAPAGEYKCLISVQDKDNASAPDCLDLTAYQIVILPVTDISVVGQPTGVTASDGTHCDRVEIEWDSVTGATGYNVYRDGNKVKSNASGSPWDDTTAIPGIHYQYQVSAVNVYGESDKSDEDEGWRGAPPGTPTGVSATNGDYDDKVTVEWKAPESGATGYNIYRDSALIKSNASGYAWDDTTVVPGTHYQYQVSAVNDCGESDKSDEDEGWAGCPAPDPPTGVTASDGTYCDKVRVQWNSVTGATGYNIYRDGNKLNPVPVTTSLWDDTTANPGTHYQYQVTAINDCGESQKSTSDEGWRKAPPDPPGGVTTTDGDCDLIRICWTAVSGATGYNIYRDGNKIMLYLPGPPCDDTTAVPGTHYQYQVSAVNDCGESQKSTSDEGWRKAPPDPPTGVTATDGASCDCVTIKWDPVPGAETYNIYRDTVAIKLNYAGTSYDDCTGQAGVQYNYCVRAKNDCGASDPSCDPGRRAAIPSPPSWLDASDGTYPNYVYLTWEGVGADAVYDIYRKDKGKIRDNNPTTSYADYDVQTGSSYEYWVIAHNTCGSSGQSPHDTGYVLDPVISLDLVYPAVTHQSPCIHANDSRLSYDWQNGHDRFTYNVRVHAQSNLPLDYVKLEIINPDTGSVFASKTWTLPGTSMTEDYSWGPFRTNQAGAGYRWLFKITAEDIYGNPAECNDEVFTIFMPGHPSGSSSNPSCGYSEPYHYWNDGDFYIGDHFYHNHCKVVPWPYDGDHAANIYEYGGNGGWATWHFFIDKADWGDPLAVTGMSVEGNTCCDNECSANKWDVGVDCWILQEWRGGGYSGCTNKWSWALSVKPCYFNSVSSTQYRVGVHVKVEPGVDNFDGVDVRFIGLCLQR